MGFSCTAEWPFLLVIQEKEMSFANSTSSSNLNFFVETYKVHTLKIFKFSINYRQYCQPFTKKHEKLYHHFSIKRCSSVKCLITTTENKCLSFLLFLPWVEMQTVVLALSEMQSMSFHMQSCVRRRAHMNVWFIWTSSDRPRACLCVFKNVVPLLWWMNLCCSDCSFLL